MDKSFWDHRYLKQKTNWDLGAASPAITRYMDGCSHKDMAILIPGCGNAYEAEYLLQHGFTNITLLDISEIVVQQLTQRFQVPDRESIKIVCTDFFKHEGQYDLILEQTFFCALLPTQRESYVQKMHGLLKPHGRLVGVLFNRSFEGGPPFGGSQEEYESLFSALFSIKVMANCYNSVKPRQGSELFLLAEK